MNLAWDYTKLASAYDKRAEYSDGALNSLFDAIGAKPGMSIADIGAGTGKLTKRLLDRGLRVTAIEPNTAMRTIGIQNTNGRDVVWREGTAENTGLPEHSVNFVGFGSSFNVADRQRALIEVGRVLRKNGWFFCLWNHRDLSDSTQSEVEALIRSLVPEFSYGTRREDQTDIIRSCGLFGKAEQIEGRFVHHTSKSDYIEAWKSHATLERQAGKNFPRVIEAIQRRFSGSLELEVPYTTQIWYAQLRTAA